MAARGTSQCMAIFRAHARVRRGHRQDRKADAATGQEAKKAGRRPVRGVHGLCVPGGRPVGGESVEAIGQGAPMEAGSVVVWCLYIWLNIMAIIRGPHCNAQYIWMSNYANKMGSNAREKRSQSD